MLRLAFYDNIQLTTLRGIDVTSNVCLMSSRVDDSQDFQERRSLMKGLILWPLSDPKFELRNIG